MKGWFVVTLPQDTVSTLAEQKTVVFGLLSLMAIYRYITETSSRSLKGSNVVTKERDL